MKVSTGSGVGYIEDISQTLNDVRVNHWRFSYDRPKRFNNKSGEQSS